MREYLTTPLLLKTNSTLPLRLIFPYDILSNGKMHSVALKDLKLPASYKYYAVPKMEKETFLLAELSDYGKYNLLPNEANIISKV